jgi:thiol-disulfide isomerase/thioredoxin
MPYLVAAMILFGALCLLNFGLTLGLIQRLRDLAAEQVERPRLREAMMGSGQRPAPFTATTLDGERVDQDTVAGNLVGFFTPNCGPCRDRAPEFVGYAREAGLDRGRVLAVVYGERALAAEMVGVLGRAARVVVEDHGGPTYHAFGVNLLPALCLLDGHGTVIVSDGTIHALPSPAVAPAQ